MRRIGWLRWRWCAYLDGQFLAEGEAWLKHEAKRAGNECLHKARERARVSPQVPADDGAPPPREEPVTPIVAAKPAAARKPRPARGRARRSATQS